MSMQQTWRQRIRDGDYDHDLVHYLTDRYSGDVRAAVTSQKLGKFTAQCEGLSYASGNSILPAACRMLMRQGYQRAIVQDVNYDYDNRSTHFGIDILELPAVTEKLFNLGHRARRAGAVAELVLADYSDAPVKPLHA